MDGLKSFLTARYGYLLVMMATVLIGIVAFVYGVGDHVRDPGSYMIAAAIAFGAATVSSRGR